ncbi:MAG: hypothetical protein EPO26_16830 [Chloroflexota bacterium]|nr:MAG: hypothetical protein EPO26_16830 [Chloroflexota bacterium]
MATVAHSIETRRGPPLPPPRPHHGHTGAGQLAIGIVVGLSITLFVLVTIMLIYARTVYSVPRADEAPSEPIVIENGVLVRPTPLWRFRDEWLTPRPKN